MRRSGDLRDPVAGPPDPGLTSAGPIRRRRGSGRACLPHDVPRRRCLAVAVGVTGGPRCVDQRAAAPERRAAPSTGGSAPRKVPAPQRHDSPRYGLPGRPARPRSSATLSCRSSPRAMPAMKTGSSSMYRRAAASSGASKMQIPVLIDPSVGPARISVPSARSRCRRSKWASQTRSSSERHRRGEIVARRVDEVDPFGHARSPARDLSGRAPRAPSRTARAAPPSGPCPCRPSAAHRGSGTRGAP